MLLLIRSAGVTPGQGGGNQSIERQCRCACVIFVERLLLNWGNGVGTDGAVALALRPIRYQNRELAPDSRVISRAAVEDPEAVVRCSVD